MLLDLVNDTLDLSRIESGKMRMILETVDSLAWLHAVIESVRPMAEEKGLQFIVHQEHFAKRYLRLDALKMQKIVLNLLSNAIKYTLPGGTVSCMVEDMPPDAFGCTWRLVVEDTGIGMSTEFLERLYEPFMQEGRIEARKITGSGTGLGLAIVKRIVDLLGGRIAVRSTLGQGSRFTVELPILPAEAEEPHLQSNFSCSSLKGLRVLLCEDNLLNIEIAIILLQELGVSAEVAHNGQEGVARFQAMGAAYYAAVLMDIRMPQMDGYEATRQIRQSGAADAKTIPILAMSADAFEEDTRQALEAGMNGFVTKPIDLSRLQRVLQECIKQS